jgi:putative nucleotidyltransferase with HDIG domain
MIQPDQDIRHRLMVARLPTMPQILLKLLELCQVDGAGMAEMAKLIANDPGMTIKILNVANSAAYQRGGQKSGLMQALGAMGSDMIKTLVINESVLQAFNGFSGSASNDLRRFWKHALSTAVMAREIARAMDYAQPEEAYLAGLLHDVGRLALLAAAPSEYAVNFQADDSDGLCAIEMRTLQISHVEAGAWVVERWNLDSFMADAILYHHELALRVEGAHPLIRMVNLAHQLANHDPALPIAAEAGALCKLSGDTLLAISQGAAAQVLKAAGFLGIDLAGVDDFVAPTAVAPPAPKVDPAQQRLGDEIRNMTMLSELGQAFARQKDDVQLLKVVRQNAQLLFGLADPTVFLMDTNGPTLRGASVSEQHQRLAGFSIPLAVGGVIAEAAIQQRVDFLGRQAGLQSLADEQLLRVFNADFVLCVPMVVGSQCVGVLVGGVAAWQVSDLQGRQKFLQSFGAQAATAWQALTRDRGELDPRLDAVRQEHRESSRRVVHEVNNPLAIIKNYLEVLDDKLTRQEPVGGEISVLHEEIDRIGHIMGEFVGVAPKAQLGTTDINEAVNKLVQLFRDSKFLPPSVEIAVRLPPQACEIEGSADTLKQILVNLVKNSVEVLPKGGRIDIVNNGQVQRNGRFYYALCISDDGPGIPSEHRSKLFTPVQSSKAGPNRGIGLSIVQGLVKKLGGTIACVSTSTKGTMFEICLPLPAAQAQAAIAPSVQDFV